MVSWGKMNFVLLRAEYDRHKERAYVEFRGPDEDRGEQSQPPFSPIGRPNDWANSKL